jgi:hypothetical protein
MRPYRSPLGAPMVRYFECSTVASTAAGIREGDLVRFDTAVGTASHRIVVATSTGGGSSNLLGISDNALLGVAVTKDDSDGSTAGLGPNRTVGVALFYPDVEFLAYVRGTGPVTSTMIGQTRSIIHDTTNRIWQIDSTNSTAALQTAIITDVPPESIGDTGAPVLFKIGISTLVHAILK